MIFDHEAAPLGEEDARRAAEGVLDLPGADGVEVVVSASRSGITRYAVSEIIQNTVRDMTNAYVRVAVGGCSATAASNQLAPEALRMAGEQALEAARSSRPDPDWAGFASPAEVGRPQPVFRFDRSTAAATPEDRALSVKSIVGASGSDNAAGIYETSSHAYSVFSSAGVACYDSFSRCIVTCLVDTGESTGWGESSSHDRNRMDLESVARAAALKAQKGRGAADAAPGTYEVVLEPSAVGVLLEYLGYAGFGARQVIEGDSFLTARAGQRVAADSVTITDDAYHPSSVGIAFDFEGVPKQRVAVIDGGIATGPVMDRRTAGQLKARSTGHFSGSSEFGPYAAHIVMEPGDASPEQLIGQVDEGFLVTRFHYVNILDRPATLLTGMTRDGTFRISGGEVAEPVHNFRFTQNVLQGLSSVRAVGRDLLAIAPEFGSFGSVVAPSVRMGEFRFTSRTSH